MVWKHPTSYQADGMPGPCRVYCWLKLLGRSPSHGLVSQVVPYISRLDLRLPALCSPSPCSLINSLFDSSVFNRALLYRRLTPLKAVGPPQAPTVRDTFRYSAYREGTPEHCFTSECRKAIPACALVLAADCVPLTGALVSSYMLARYLNFTDPALVSV